LFTVYITLDSLISPALGVTERKVALTEIWEDSFIYAAIHQANISEPATDHCGINYYQQLGPVVVVDLTSVQCVVGRIRDCNKWAIVDRSESLAQIHSS
jgi:hypothetical protein